jgi:hypothetical protein
MPLLPGDGSEYGRLIPEEFRELNEAELDQALLQRGLQFVAADPGRYLWLCLGRLKEYFKFWPSPDSGLVSNAARVSSFGVFLPFMAWGIALVMTGQVPEPGNPASDRGAAALPLLVAVAYTTIHVMVWALVRYRLPVDALLVPFAAVSVVWILDRAGVRWRARARYQPSPAP